MFKFRLCDAMRYKKELLFAFSMNFVLFHGVIADTVNASIISVLRIHKYFALFV